ncbi:hypothetical protein GF391_03365 [Candidatus Uhrbacteria bacterium]|nr:hypothetical protein [Candidatus Uhrbacteria bacterium]
MKKALEAYLGYCVRNTISRDKPQVIAIGGSVGKTSARHAISLAMSALFKPREYRTSLKNYNNELGMPLSVLACGIPNRNIFKWLKVIACSTAYLIGLKRLNMRYLILEMAADHPGDLDYLLRIAPPQIAIMTAMGAEHVEHFGSVESAIEEERRILRALPEDGEAILNTDDAFTWESRDLVKGEVVGFGRGAEAIVRIESMKSVFEADEFDNSGLEVKFKVMGYHDFAIRLKGVFGEPHAYAVAAAFVFCLCMDHDLDSAIAKLEEDYNGMPGRTRLIKGIKSTILLDDTYNAQPQAMKSAINDLARFPVQEGGRRIAVLGDMLELGDLEQREHELVGEKVVEVGVDILLTCGKLGRIIAETAIARGMDESRIKFFDSSDEAGYFLQQEVIRPGDVILAKGSQGARMEKVIKELMAEPMKAKDLLVRQTPEWLS